jgi:hypothetical protein
MSSTTPVETDTQEPMSRPLAASAAQARGMTPTRVWARTNVHRNTHSYQCAWCEVTLRTPAAFYRHLDAVCVGKKRRKR